ncbi:MAG: response regulator [Rhodothermales bacterium]|nr:response regulator [Rhodothermales bacterium]
MTGADRLRVLIADDEALARQRITDLLAAVNDVEVVGTAGSGREAVAAITALEPDLVFLDIQMPGLTGLDVVREVGPDAMPATIFVTAFDHHTLEAFDLAAIDYLLKPFEDERFHRSLERARKHVRLNEIDSLRNRLAALLDIRDSEAEIADDRARPKPPDSGSGYVERIAVEMRGQMRVVPVEKIDYIDADGPYAQLHVGSDTYVIRERMRTLEDRLDPNAFVRIHRSVIVRIDRIDSVLIGSGGDYAVRLVDGQRLKVSRGRYDKLVNRLGLDSLG